MCSPAGNIYIKEEELQMYLFLCYKSKYVSQKGSRERGLLGLGVLSGVMKGHRMKSWWWATHLHKYSMTPDVCTLKG